MLKLARSGEDGDKVLLLVESGVRLHTIQAMPPKADTPSNFTLKLRKHIRCGGRGGIVGQACHDAAAPGVAAAALRPSNENSSAVPCPLCRTRRLEAVKQLGVDRIVQMTFGSGPAACHLLLEFYAQASSSSSPSSPLD